MPTLAALGGLALFASLVTGWQVTTLNVNAFNGPPGPANFRRVESTLGDLGSWGGGYLTGTFLLAGAMALLLFGTPAARRPARLVVLGTCGALLAVLAATAVELRGQSRVLSDLVYILPDTQSQPVEYGRGIVFAVVGVLAVGAAALLAGQLPTGPAPYARAGDPAGTHPGGLAGTYPGDPAGTHRGNYPGDPAGTHPGTYPGDLAGAHPGGLAGIAPGDPAGADRAGHPASAVPPAPGATHREPNRISRWARPPSTEPPVATPRDLTVTPTTPFTANPPDHPR